MIAPADPPIHGVCHGYGVVSDLEFAYLREGSGDRLTVVEVDPPRQPLEGLVFEWERGGRQPFSARLYGEPSGPYHLWIEPDDWYVIDPAARSIGVPETPEVVKREQRLWGLPALLMFLAAGDMPLHAAAVEVDGRAVLLAGPSRHGKTSLALGFARQGYRILSEDLVRIQFGSSTPMVFPGPAGVRVRADVAGVTAGLDLRVIGGDGDREFMALDAGQRGSGRPLPIAGTVLLKGEADMVDLEPVQPALALRDLWLLSLSLPTQEAHARKLGHLSDLVDSVPTLDLRRPMLLSALEATVVRIASDMAR